MKSIAALCTTVLAVSAVEFSGHVDPRSRQRRQQAKEQKILEQASSICYEMNFHYKMVVPSHDDLQEHGWKLVRRVKKGTTWHPAKDHAVGSETYGTCDHNAHNSDVTFSCKYDNEKFDQMLFTSGDNKVWLQTAKAQALDMFGYAARTIIASSERAGSYKAEWYNRSSQPEDPWVSIYNHGKDANGATVGWTSSKNPVMYGENSHPGWSYTISQHNGANVYIRDRASCQAKADADAAMAVVEAIEKRHEAEAHAKAERIAEYKEDPALYARDKAAIVAFACRRWGVCLHGETATPAHIKGIVTTTCKEYGAYCDWI